jgi:hypothetical protein
MPVKSVGDQGVDWLCQSLKRTKQQAAKEGRNAEDVTMGHGEVRLGLSCSKTSDDSESISFVLIT